MNPLRNVGSLKLKLGLVIVAAVFTTLLINEAGIRLNFSIKARWAVAVLVALGMVQLLARGMTSPLREMAAAAEAMARGDYSRRVSESSRDEVGALGRAFNAMASDLAQVDQVRRDLIANVSHDLRTPITSLRAVLENLADGVTQPDPETLRAVVRQVDRLGRLVAQLLDLSRLESGVVPLQREVVDVPPLLAEAAAESRLTSPDVTVQVEVPDGLRVHADRERLHQVLANLLDNAARFTPAGEPVLLVARADGEELLLEVHDAGPGIPAGEAERVFDRFYRADASRSAANGTGAGLGLSIARWVVDLHGGEIRAEPRQPHGTTVVVHLPGVVT